MGFVSLPMGAPSYADFIGEDSVPAGPIQGPSAPPAAAQAKPAAPAMIPKSLSVPQAPAAKIPAPSRPAAAADSTLGYFFSDNLTPGAQVAMYPATGAFPLPAMTDAVTFGRLPTLEINLGADDYSGCSICAATPMDLGNALQNGILEFRAKGATGGEAFNIGLLDDGENEARRPLQVWTNVRTFAVIPASGWTRVRIPLVAFGSRGGYWTGESAGPLFSVFNWSGVRCLTLDLEKGQQKSFRIWMAGARFIRTGPKPVPMQHAGYVYRNEPDSDAQAAGGAK